MADYIDKNDLREYISGYIKSCNGKPTYTDIDAMVGIISLLEQMPASDVQPIRRGQWKLTNNPSFRKCSECGAWWGSDITNNCFTNYCPKCGARMDGEQNEVD